MNNKLKELMELSNSVDVICREVEKANEEKKVVVKQKLKDRWNAMIDDIQSFYPVIKSLGRKGCHRIGKYDFGYPYGYKAIGPDGVTFIYNEGYPVKTYIDHGGGWNSVERRDFDQWYSKYPKTVETLLENWRGGYYNVYSQIEKDLEKRLSESIKKRANECRKQTEELDKKLAEY